MSGVGKQREYLMAVYKTTPSSIINKDLYLTFSVAVQLPVRSRRSGDQSASSQRVWEVSVEIGRCYTYIGTEYLPTCSKSLWGHYEASMDDAFEVPIRQCLVWLSTGTGPLFNLVYVTSLGS